MKAKTAELLTNPASDRTSNQCTVLKSCSHIPSSIPLDQLLDSRWWNMAELTLNTILAIGFPGKRKPATNSVMTFSPRVVFVMAAIICPEAYA